MGSIFFGGENMEKLVIEVELTKQELEEFKNFIKQGCLDQEKYIKRLLMGAITGKRDLALLTAKRKEGKKAV